MSVQMKIKLMDGARCPTRAHPTDAGLDLYARDGATIESGHSAVFDTGVCIELPHGCYGKIESKSGLNVKHGVVCCGGVIDEPYRGSICVKLYNLSDEEYTVNRGDKIAQLVIMHYVVPEMVVVDELSDTDRGADGFGSTGR